MSYKNVKAHSLGHLRAATSSTNLCLGLFCGRAMLGQLLCDMSCVLSMIIILKKSHHIGTWNPDNWLKYY